MAAEAVEQFERNCENAPIVQEQLLQRILAANNGVEYLRKFDPEGTLDPETFRARVPLIVYEDIAPYVERIADGDGSPILSNDPVVSFSLSSGTTGGRPKVIPETSRCSALKGNTYMISGEYRRRAFSSKNGETGLAFYYAGKQYETKSGLKIGAGSTNYFRSEAFKSSPFKYTSRTEVVLGHDWRESTYCHLLCGLSRRSEVDHIISIFAFTVVEAIRMLRNEWRNICHDLETGTLNDEKVSDSDMRRAVLGVLKPDPELAEMVARVCERECWKGIIRELWPKAEYVLTVGTGAMRPYVPPLREFAGEVRVSFMDYVSSEAVVGVNIDPLSDVDDVSFTVVPDTFYLEFIPQKRSGGDDDDGDESFEEEGEPVGAGEVQVGKFYEVVVTSFAGLYRYRIGDVVKVTGFFKKSPQLAFSRRKTALLSINTDKTDEEELQNVVLKTGRDAGVQVRDFTSHADLKSEPGHYVIYWELVDPEDYHKSDVLEKCATILDRSFNNPYLRGRAAGTIGALELVVVKQGTFVGFLERALRRGASPGQYKIPRCTNDEELLKLLEVGAAARFTSLDFGAPLLRSWKPTFHH